MGQNNTILVIWVVKSAFFCISGIVLFYSEQLKQPQHSSSNNSLVGLTMFSGSTWSLTLLSPWPWSNPPASISTNSVPLASSELTSSAGVQNPWKRNYHFCRSTCFSSYTYLSYQSGEGGEQNGKEFSECAVGDHQISNCLLAKEQVLAKDRLQSYQPWKCHLIQQQSIIITTSNLQQNFSPDVCLMVLLIEDCSYFLESNGST